jgi:cullin-4
MSEWLAKHVDSVLKASKGKQDMVAGDDVEATLEQIMVLFRRLHAKDIFEAFYQKDLSKRLLHGKSSSIDLERTFLSKLKAECGTAYTSKMEGMFKDIDLSRDIISQYSDFALRDAAASNSRPAVEMDVQVLTTGYWPQFPQQKSIKLPEELKVHVSRFENYYDSKYQGRRITWQYSLCNCLVKANFPGKKVELLVTLYQALVLRCFNDHDTLSIPQIMEQTGIEDRAEVERLLHSLSTGKPGTRVLIMKSSADGMDMKADSRTSNKKSISDTDEFCYNSRFTSKLNRLKIPALYAKDIGSDADNSAKIHEAASRDRAYLIDAAIVRIMKARKTMPHRDLMGEVMNQVKHVSRPTPTEIKKRIEGLMEREYLERDASDKSVYNYLA